MGSALPTGEVPELRDVPAVAVCAQCGDPQCPGHEFEQSGERPVLRMLPWEDGDGAGLPGLWRTAMVVSTDLPRWIRGSCSVEAGVGSALTFALACEWLAVLLTLGPLCLVLSGLAFVSLGLRAALLVATACARIGAFLVPMMLVIHVVFQWVVARTGARRGMHAPTIATVRAALFACGWDLATGPAGIIAALVRRDSKEAWERLDGNRHLFSRALVQWLKQMHGVSSSREAERAVRPWMIVLLLLTCLGVGMAIVATLEQGAVGVSGAAPVWARHHLVCIVRLLLVRVSLGR